MRNQVLKEWKILTTCTQATNVSFKYSWRPEATKPPETVPYIKNFKTFASIFESLSSMLTVLWNIFDS